MCTVSSENVCEEEHAQVVGSCGTQKAYNTVQELAQALVESLRTTKATRSFASDLLAFSCPFCERLCSQT